MNTRPTHHADVVPVKEDLFELDVVTRVVATADVRQDFSFPF